MPNGNLYTLRKKACFPSSARFSHRVVSVFETDMHELFLSAKDGFLVDNSVGNCIFPHPEICLLLSFGRSPAVEMPLG